MQKQAFFQIKEEKGKGLKFESIVPIPYVEWNDYNDEVTIEFHREIMPYLINLKKNLRNMLYLILKNSIASTALSYIVGYP
jgi:plasmid replication initiation protein